MRTLYTGFDGYREPNCGTYTVEDGVLVDPGSTEPKNDRISNLQRGHNTPHLRCGGPDPRVDTTTVTVRHTSPRKA